MKIAFIGGVKFSHELLSHIIQKGWKISVLFSFNDSKIKHYSDLDSFDNITKKYEIRHNKVDNINDPENIELLKKINPDLILVMGWSQLLKNEIIQIPRLGVIGSHPTELPKYRGRSPLPWSIIKDLKESALTFFYIKDGIDDGDILDQKKFVINNNDTATTLYDKIISLGKQMLEENLPLIEKGTSKKIRQDQSKFIESWSKRSPDDGQINWNEDCKTIQTLIRASTHPYPGAFTNFRGKKLKIWKADYDQSQNAEPGKIIKINSIVKVGTGKGVLLIKNASIDDGEEMEADKIFLKKDIFTVLG